jgi:tight adherence protein C
VTLLFVIALVLLGVAAALVVRALALSRVRMETQLRQIQSYGFDGALQGQDALRAAPPFGPGVNAFAEGAGSWALARVGVLEPLTRSQLAAAGVYNLTPEAFHGYRVLAAAGATALALLFAVALGASTALTLVLLVWFAISGWVLVGGQIRRRGERRHDAVDRELPELIDVLVATVEAGMGFAGSLQLVAGRFDGPLGEELRLTLQEQNMGLSTAQALTNMLERCDSAAVRSFVRAVIQAENLGVSMGTMMRNLAVEMRQRRRMSARERVQRAPVKMLVPLILLILPAMLIVLLYPAVTEIGKTLSGG